MYAKYFGLIEIPFKILPDPRYLWYSNQHKEAKAKIEYHISQKDGPVYLSAEVSLGRTELTTINRLPKTATPTKRISCKEDHPWPRNLWPAREAWRWSSSRLPN